MEDEQNGHPTLQKMAELFLTIYNSDEPQNLELPEVMSAAVGVLKQIFACLLVLLNPIPSVLGTDVSDVSSTLKPPPGRVLSKLESSVQVFLRDGPWQKKLDESLQKGAASMKYAAAFQELEAALSNDASQQELQLKVGPGFKEAVQKLPELRDALRPGATAGLEKQMSLIFRSAVKSTVQLKDVSGVSPDHVAVLTRATELLANRQGILELQSNLKAWAGEMAHQLGAQKLVAILDRWQSLADEDFPWKEVNALLDGVGSKIPDELLEKIQELAAIMTSNLADKACA